MFVEQSLHSGLAWRAGVRPGDLLHAVDGAMGQGATERELRGNTSGRVQRALKKPSCVIAFKRGGAALEPIGVLKGEGGVWTLMGRPLYGIGCDGDVQPKWLCANPGKPGFEKKARLVRAMVRRQLLRLERAGGQYVGTD